MKTYEKFVRMPGDFSIFEFLEQNNMVGVKIVTRQK